VISELVRSHDAAEATHSERLWALVNLEIWHRVFIDGEAPGEIMRRSAGARMARAAR